MLKKVQQNLQVKRKIQEERRRLLYGVELAKCQWQFGQIDQDENGNKYEHVDILERRYMFLYQIAKKKKLHALE